MTTTRHIKQMTAEEFKNRVIPYSRKIYPMLMRILKDEEETKDALQELMFKLWNKRDQLEKCENTGAYIAVMARNYSYDVLKKNDRRGLVKMRSTKF
jgi:RNA polymerase sigma-70 factor (ECF subfamily)